MSDCYTCTHAIGADMNTARRFRTLGYSLGKGDLTDVVAVCEKHRIVAPSTCADYERENGSD